MSSPLQNVLKRTASRQRLTSLSESVSKQIPASEEVRKTISIVSSGTLAPLVAPVSGFVAAFCEICVLFPSEYLKVQVQLNKNNAEFKVISHLKEQKFKIYQGLPPMLIGAPLQGLLRFSCLDLLSPKNGRSSKYSIAEKFSLGPKSSGLIAGILAGSLESLLVVTPMETVKTKLIDSNKGLISGTRHIIKKQGIKGLYNGLGATVAKSASNQAIRFVVFNDYKDYMLKRNTNRSSLTAMESLGGGVLAGLVGCLLNTPIDVVKSRVQSMSNNKNMFSTVMDMGRNEGLSSFYKGLFWRSARVVPGQGIIFLVYEQTSKRLNSLLN